MCGEMKTLAAIPAWNQEKKVSSVVLLARKYVDNVLVIDDGSIDRTAEVAERAGATVVRHNGNRGYGAAIQSCFKYAKENNFDAMVILDSDGQHDPDQIPIVLKTIIDGKADLSIGSRFIGNNAKIPFYRKIGIGVITEITNIGSGKSHKVLDSQSGFRAYSRKAIETINPADDNMGASVEILLQARKKGLRFIEVPIKCEYGEGASTQGPIKHGLGVLASIVQYVEVEHSLLAFGVPGLMLVVISAFTGMWSYISYRQTGYLPFGPTMITMLLFVIGMFSGITGLILHAVINANRRMWRK